MLSQKGLYIREALNHCKVRRSMAETALDMTSRWRSKSVSSSVGGGAGTCGCSLELLETMIYCSGIYSLPTPGGKAPEDAEGGGWLRLFTDTVARSIFRRTTTQLFRLGNTVLYRTLAYSCSAPTIPGLHKSLRLASVASSLPFSLASESASWFLPFGGRVELL